MARLSGLVFICLSSLIFHYVPYAGDISHFWSAQHLNCFLTFRKFRRILVGNKTCLTLRNWKVWILIFLVPWHLEHRNVTQTQWRPTAVRAQRVQVGAVVQWWCPLSGLEVAPSRLLLWVLSAVFLAPCSTLVLAYFHCLDFPALMLDLGGYLWFFQYIFFSVWRNPR